MTQPILKEAIAWMELINGPKDARLPDRSKIDVILEAARAYEAIQSQVDMRQLEIALKNAVKPNYSEECGEWVLFCGGKESSEAILQAAKLIAGQHDNP